MIDNNSIQKVYQFTQIFYLSIYNLFMDTYTLCRIFKTMKSVNSEEITKNIIIIAGDIHIRK